MYQQLRKFVRISVLSLISLTAIACDSGNDISIKTSDNNTCNVTMKANKDDFKIKMTLLCAAADHQECYTITSLTCQGQDKTLEQPIVVDNCPAEEWCIKSCSKGLENDGRLFDIPSLKAVDGCNSYAK